MFNPELLAKSTNKETEWILFPFLFLCKLYKKRRETHFVKIGVNERIERRIKVSDPEEDFDHNVRTVAGLSAQGDGQIPDEERQPTEYESSHNDAKGSSRLMLSPNLLQMFVFATGTTRCFTIIMMIQ